MTDSNLVVREDSGVTIIGFGGSTLIDAEHIEQIAGELYELIDKKKVNRLVLDFSSIKLMASRMLGVLLTLKKKSEAQKGGLALCAVREDLMKVFAVTNLDRTFSFFADEATALAHLGRVDEARAALARVHAINPTVSATFIDAVLPFRNPADRDHYIDGLRKAGLPE